MKKELLNFGLPLVSGFFENQCLVLIMGHMRSGSSLLNHFLLSVDKVNGIGESNITYKGNNDVTKLKVKAFLKGAKLFRFSKYVCDQINHSHKTPDLALFRNSPIKIIYIIRSPQPSISSLIHISKEFYNNSWTVQKASAYYIDRLKYLANISNDLANGVFITYEELISNSELCLQKIETYLGISFDSYHSYKTYNFTGHRGDPELLIRKARITIGSSRPLIDLSPDLKEQVTEVYKEVLSKMAN